MQFRRRGIMLVIASPSGAGKTSITRALMARNPDLALSVSVTTRQKRRDEVEGMHYYFISVPEFERRRAEGLLLGGVLELHGSGALHPGRRPIPAPALRGRHAETDRTP